MKSTRTGGAKGGKGEAVSRKEKHPFLCYQCSMVGSRNHGTGWGASGWWYTGEVGCSASAHHAPPLEEFAGFSELLLAASCIGQCQCVKIWQYAAGSV